MSGDRQQELQAYFDQNPPKLFGAFEIKCWLLGCEIGSSCAGSIAGDGRWSSFSEALDLTTPSGRALAGMLAVFAEFERDILRDRVKAGIAQARKEGRPHGRPPSVAKYIPQVRSLARRGSAKVRAHAASVSAGPLFADSLARLRWDARNGRLADKFTRSSLQRIYAGSHNSRAFGHCDHVTLAVASDAIIERR
jgi:Resolvase, N terminal domain